MDYKQTTQVPNFLLDNFLVHLTESEIKVALVVNRQPKVELKRIEMGC